MATVVRYEAKGLSQSAIYTFLGVGLSFGTEPRRPVRYLVRYAADPALDAGDGEPPYDCCGASRRWFFANCGRRPNRVVFRLVV